MKNFLASLFNYVLINNNFLSQVPNYTEEKIPLLKVTYREVMNSKFLGGQSKIKSPTMIFSPIHNALSIKSINSSRELHQSGVRSQISCKEKSPTWNERYSSNRS